MILFLSIECSINYLVYIILF